MFIAGADRRGRSTDTLDYYVRKSRQLLRILGASTDINTITLADTEQYLDTREAEGTAGRATIGKELNLLKWALYNARRHGLFHGDPIAVTPEGLEGASKPGERRLTMVSTAPFVPPFRPPGDPTSTRSAALAPETPSCTEFSLKTSSYPTPWYSSPVPRTDGPSGGCPSLPT